MSTYYDVSTQTWYWQEFNHLFGGYETEAETVIEQYCVQGSDKYQQLQEGQVKPRLGDFVKGCLDGFNCGLVSRLDVQLKTSIGLIYMNANDEEQFVAYEDVIWIAPYEWSSCNEENL